MASAPAPDVPRIARSIRVRGQVQGVGYRPFVWQWARRLGLAGSVSNDAQGVLIHATGAADAVARLVVALKEAAPPLAHVHSVEVAEWQGGDDPGDFTIAPSSGGAVATGVAADAATCPDCLAEMRDPADRRHGYPFANCTHCGPRLTIVSAVPYDRAATSMAPFVLCADCAAEYADPADRRFHAQPIACPACGPRLWIEGEGAVAADPLAAAARMLREGRIVAVKGIGGFHLACLAMDAAAVAELRRRKARDAKPLAVMVADLGAARALCRVSDEAAAMLSGSAAPIVLLSRRGDVALPDALAPGQDHLGVMLAYSPLHHLLLAQVGAPLVMTSGNRSDEPQASDNDEARARLNGIADAWLMHDRAIVNRVDDSVVAADACGPMVLRRARGLAPDPILLPPGLQAAVPVLAMGGELKATFCLLRGREAVLSPHIGDLEDAAALGDYQRMLALFRRLYDFTPGAIAVDAHGDYLSTQLGRGMAATLGVPLVTVAHHHAHMAACLAENGATAADTAMAIVCDGLGMGADGTLWGGEILSGGYAASERVAGLPAIPLPGGAQAMRQPWRNLIAHLAHALGPGWRTEAAALTAHLPDAATVALVEQAMARGLNSPACSSAGRLFDAAAAAIGVHADRISHEGQAAMALESLARGAMASTEAYPMTDAALADLWRGMAADVAAGVAPEAVAARFHHSFAAIMLHLLERVGTVAGRRVALSGGVFNNRIVREQIAAGIAARGGFALVHHRLPAGDGGLSLGQAVVAAAGLG